MLATGILQSMANIFQYYCEKASVLRLAFKNEQSTDSDDQFLAVRDHNLASQVLLRITPLPCRMPGNRKYLGTYCTSEDVTSAAPRLRSILQASLSACSAQDRLSPPPNRANAKRPPIGGFDRLAGHIAVAPGTFEFRFGRDTRYCATGSRHSRPAAAFPQRVNHV